jgi:hypothetical protein
MRKALAVGIALILFTLIIGLGLVHGLDLARAQAWL